jgi:hypothetical protein
MVEFTDYPNVLIRMLNLCIREPQSHLGIFLMLKGKEARLDFIQNMVSSNLLFISFSIILNRYHLLSIISNEYLSSLFRNINLLN